MSVKSQKSNITISIANKNISTDSNMEGTLISASVLRDTKGAGHFSLELATTWNVEQPKTTNFDNLELGSEITIKMGYDGNLNTVMLGKIHALKTSFFQEAIPTVQIEGFDLLYDLMRLVPKGQKTFQNMTYDTVISKVTKDRNFIVNVDLAKIPKGVIEYVSKGQKTDWQFLQEILQEIGYEMFFDYNNKQLSFRSIAEKVSKFLTLTYGEDLFDFEAQINITEQYDTIEMEVQTGDKNESEALQVSVQGITSKAEIMGETNGFGPKAAKQALGSSIKKIPGIKEKEKSQDIALAAFQDMSSEYVTAQLTCQGNPDLVPGQGIEILRVGKKLSGIYRIDRVSHSYSLDGGYTSVLSVTRNATG